MGTAHNVHVHVSYMIELREISHIYRNPDSKHDMFRHVRQLVCYFRANPWHNMIRPYLYPVPSTALLFYTRTPPVNSLVTFVLHMNITQRQRVKKIYPNFLKFYYPGLKFVK
jgi:hypothetical protein